MKTRPPWLRALTYAGRAAKGAVVATIVAAVWGSGIEPRLIDEVRYEVRIPHLPIEWEGRTIAVIADLQVGMWSANTDTIRRIVERLTAMPPAAVLIAGDFIYFPSDEEREDAVEELEGEDVADSLRHATQAASIVRPLARSGIPTFAVLGNHDYAMMWPTSVPRRRVAAEVVEALHRAGIKVLHNEVVALRRPAAGRDTVQRSPATLYLVGVGPHLPGEDKAAAAVSTLPNDAARIVFMHNPASFLALPPDSSPLAIAAHTHGGQIRVPFLPRWSWLSIAQEGGVVADGWIHGHGQRGNRLYVNRGIGFSTLPVRINCRPELTIFTLRQTRARR